MSTHWKDLTPDPTDPTVALLKRRRAVRGVITRLPGRPRNVPARPALGWCDTTLPQESFNPIRGLERRSS